MLLLSHFLPCAVDHASNHPSLPVPQALTLKYHTSKINDFADLSVRRCTNDVTWMLPVTPPMCDTEPAHIWIPRGGAQLPLCGFRAGCGHAHIRAGGQSCPHCRPPVPECDPAYLPLPSSDLFVNRWESGLSTTMKGGSQARHPARGQSGRLWQ